MDLKRVVQGFTWSGKTILFLNCVWMHGRVMNGSLCSEGKVGRRKEGGEVSILLFSDNNYKWEERRVAK